MVGISPNLEQDPQRGPCLWHPQRHMKASPSTHQAKSHIENHEQFEPGHSATLLSRFFRQTATGSLYSLHESSSSWLCTEKLHP